MPEDTVTWLDWMQMWDRRPAPPSDPDATVDVPHPPKRRMTGKYSSLYTYLEKRYADTVVLTFDQIELRSWWRKQIVYSQSDPLGQLGLQQSSCN